MNNIEILIVEDEAKMARTIREYLEHVGYSTHISVKAMDAQEYFLFHKNEIDLILLDLMLPDMSGYQLLKEIRKVSEVPVIILSAMSEIDNQMAGFETGADDYLTKPFSLKLLKLHIDAVLKRAGKFRKTLNYGELSADMEQQKVYLRGEQLMITKKEFDLLVYFMDHPGVMLSRKAILDAVWEYDYSGDIRTIDTLVKQLRKKLGDCCNYIRTVYGAGYVFEEETDETGKTN